MNKQVIPVVDLFAGPGGLGEGFSSLEVNRNGQKWAPFRISLSLEKEAFAHRTLRLRAFYRLLVANEKPLESYYSYISGKSAFPYTPDTKTLWERSGEEALDLVIGSPEATRVLRTKVRKISEGNKHWVLIGGPPCQAYSLAGRSRNKGVMGYKPEKDKRHFLYEDYLELITEFRPSIFVMENVKGIISSKISGSKIFLKILEDLRAANIGKKSYKIFSLSNRDAIYSGTDDNTVDPHDFIVRSELYGIPQARHRVILVGIREDVASDEFRTLKRKRSKVSLREAIVDLPKLRSGLSRGDSYESWRKEVADQARAAASALSELCAEDRRRLRQALRHVIKGKLPYMERGALRMAISKTRPSTFAKKLRDKKLAVVLNHESRGHMASDLSRYLFAAAFGKVRGESPRQEDFPKALAPKHANWFSGAFKDRFRVQLVNEPSTTVTCHIAKDGHYYIHFDPKQCRSLTVREAARLQTFPDNYFFEGNRTEQYIQVGNAVPPLLARQIAKTVWNVLND